MVESATDFLAREYESIREREGRDFFLALGPFVEELDRRPETHEVLTSFKSELEIALQRFADEQSRFVEEAKQIRDELAARAPEIDNSDMERPDRRSDAYRTGISTASRGSISLSSATRSLKSDIHFFRTARRTGLGLSRGCSRSSADGFAPPSMAKTPQSVTVKSGVTSTTSGAGSGTSASDNVPPCSSTNRSRGRSRA